MTHPLPIPCAPSFSCPENLHYASQKNRIHIEMPEGRKAGMSKRHSPMALLSLTPFVPLKNLKRGRYHIYDTPRFIDVYPFT